MEAAGSLTVHNDLNECIVVVTYSAGDTVQVLPTSRTEIDKQAVTNIILREGEGKNLRAHVCRIGLFGMTSPRTRLTSGLGFDVVAGKTYCVRAINADSKGNLCSFLEFNPVDGTLAEIISPTGYKFGDKLIKPALRLTGIDRLFTVDGSVFEDHMKAREEFRKSDTSSRPVHLSPPAYIEEREIWGVFFEQALRVGVNAYRSQEFISTDDLELQEPYLFIGIPALALYSLIIRSLPDPDGLIFIDGRRVTDQTCPESFHMLFGLLIETKQRLVTITSMSQDEENWIQQFLLYSSSNKAFQGELLAFLSVFLKLLKSD